MARSVPQIIGVVFIILSAILNFISFVSPYWLVSEERANSPLEKIGLWEACLKDFVDPKDYVSKLYNGCWWIFWPEYAEIRYWLNPPWFRALQGISTLSFMATILAAILVISGTNKASISTAFASFGFTLIDTILFGLGSIDRTWMPKVDFNHLSWGYWLHVIGGFFAFISFVGLLSSYINDREKQVEVNEKY